MITSCRLRLMPDKVQESWLYSHSRKCRFRRYPEVKKGFRVRYDMIYSVDDRHIKFPNLDKPIKISESCFIIKGTIKNPRVLFDGEHWYLSYSCEVKLADEDLFDDILSISLGIENLMEPLSGVAYSGINDSSNIIKLQRKIARC